MLQRLPYETPKAFGSRRSPFRHHRQRFHSAHSVAVSHLHSQPVAVGRRRFISVAHLHSQSVSVGRRRFISVSSTSISLPIYLLQLHFLSFYCAFLAKPYPKFCPSPTVCCISLMKFDVDEGFPVNCSNIGDPIGSPQSVANKKMKIENERELQGVNPQEDDFMKVTGEDIFICKCSKIGDSIGATESVSLITTKRKRAASEHTLSIFQEIPYDLSSIAELNVANPSLMSSFDQRTVYGADILGIHKVWLSDIENQLKQSSIDQAQAMLRIETKKKGVQELAARLRESTDELRVAESRVTSVSYSFLSLVLGLAQKSRDPLEDYGKTC